jgi:hypothetical protein
VATGDLTVGLAAAGGDRNGNSRDVVRVRQLSRQAFDLALNRALQEARLSESLEGSKPSIPLHDDEAVVLFNREKGLVRRVPTSSDALRHLERIVVFEEMLNDLARGSCRRLATEPRVLRVQVETRHRKPLRRPTLSRHRLSSEFSQKS